MGWKKVITTTWTDCPKCKSLQHFWRSDSFTCLAAEWTREASGTRVRLPSAVLSGFASACLHLPPFLGSLWPTALQRPICPASLYSCWMTLPISSYLMKEAFQDKDQASANVVLFWKTIQVEMRVSLAALPQDPPTVLWMWPSFIIGLLTLQLEWICWGKAQQLFLPPHSTAEGTACVWAPVEKPTHTQMMATSSSALQSPSQCLHQQSLWIRNMFGKDPKCVMTSKKKKKKAGCASLSKQLYSTLISSTQHFELNLATELYLHWETSRVFIMLDDAILLTYVLVYKQ